MFFLKTEESLTTKQKKILRKAFKKRTGEDCVILDCGLRVETHSTKKDKAASR